MVTFNKSFNIFSGLILLGLLSCSNIVNDTKKVIEQPKVKMLVLDPNKFKKAINETISSNVYVNKYQDKYYATLITGRDGLFTGQVQYENDIYDQNIVWKSENPDILKISEKGEFKALGTGKAVIEAITVNQPKISEKIQVEILNEFQEFSRGVIDGKVCDVSDIPLNNVYVNASIKRDNQVIWADQTQTFNGDFVLRNVPLETEMEFTFSKPGCTSLIKKVTVPGQFAFEGGHLKEINLCKFFNDSSEDPDKEFLACNN